MKDRNNWVPKTAKRFRNYLSRLRDKRITITQENRATRKSRSSLTRKQRENILKKTNLRCHICGGTIKGKWQADHILSYSKGGGHTEDNYLSAHNTCNNYRWHYSSEEFQEIMKLGVWVQTQIVNNTQVGNDVAEKFVKHEINRIKRRVNSE